MGISWSQGSAAAREAVPALVERLGDVDPAVRAFAAGALMKVAPLTKELLPALAALEGGADGTGRQVAAWLRSEIAQRARPRPAAQGPRGTRVQTVGPTAPPRSTAPAPASQPSTRRKREIG